jgi:hypothetical protein
MKFRKLDFKEVILKTLRDDADFLREVKELLLDNPAGDP